jgi:hypothetical protein
MVLKQFRNDIEHFVPKTKKTMRHGHAMSHARHSTVSVQMKPEIKSGADNLKQYSPNRLAHMKEKEFLVQEDVLRNFSQLDGKQVYPQNFKVFFFECTLQLILGTPQEQSNFPLNPDNFERK